MFPNSASMLVMFPTPLGIHVAILPCSPHASYCWLPLRARLHPGWTHAFGHLFGTLLCEILKCYFLLIFHHTPLLKVCDLNLPSQPHAFSTCRVQEGKYTQLAAHSLCKATSSTPHTCAAFSFSLMESIIPCWSKQEKNLSRVLQQWSRAVRLGASYAPSLEGAGSVWEAVGGEEVNRPMSILTELGKGKRKTRY